MKAIIRKTAWLALLAAFFLSSAKAGQSRGSSQQPQPSPPPPQQTQTKPAQPSAFSLDDALAPPPASTAEEDAAFKAVMDKKTNDTPHRVELGEAFIKKYPQSRYLEPVLSAMTLNYLNTNKIPQAIATGDKALGMNPDDVLVLALLSQTLSRAWSPTASDAQAQLDKAEKYARRTIELTPTLKKPPELMDQEFTNHKNKLLSMVHSGLGVVIFQRRKFTESIPDLEEAVKIVPDPDPVNYYVLALANQSAQHFNDAVAAFTKCGEIVGPVQATCKARIDDAKKRAATQISAPK